VPHISNTARRSHFATAGGAGAILLWSTTVAVARSLSEQLGPVTAAAAAYGVSGIVALAALLHGRRGRERIRFLGCHMRAPCAHVSKRTTGAPRNKGVLPCGLRATRIMQLPAKYLIGCGTLFVAYMLLLFLAIGWARNRQQVLEVGLLNYLWPALTLVLSLVLLGKKASWMLIPGTLLALAGVFLVVTQGEYVSWQSLRGNFCDNPGAYAMALAAAVAWAMYSTLTRRWAGGQEDGAVLVFLPITAGVLVLICCFLQEPRNWSRQAVAEALFLGIATYLAYVLWDNAMRRGNVIMVAAASYLTPLFSTIVSCLYLAVVPGARLWGGCAILIFGSILSWRSVSARRDCRGKASASTSS